MEHKHYNNKNGSLYKFAEEQGLNSWEFDIIKRIVRCRKKGQFTEDLEKTKDVIDLYLSEYNDEEWEVGDEVQITESVYGHCFDIGDIVTIEDVVGGKKPNYIAENNLGSNWYIGKEEGKLINK